MMQRIQKILLACGFFHFAKRSLTPDEELLNCYSIVKLAISNHLRNLHLPILSTLYLYCALVYILKFNFENLIFLSYYVVQQVYSIRYIITLHCIRIRITQQYNGIIIQHYTCSIKIRQRTYIHTYIHNFFIRTNQGDLPNQFTLAQFHVSIFFIAIHVFVENAGFPCSSLKRGAFLKPGGVDRSSFPSSPPTPPFFFTWPRTYVLEFQKSIMYFRHAIVPIRPHFQRSDNVPPTRSYRTYQLVERAQPLQYAFRRTNFVLRRRL